MEKETEVLKNKHKDYITTQEEAIKEIQSRFEKEKRELTEDREKMQKNTEKVREAVDRLNGKMKNAIDGLYKQLADEREASTKKFLDVAESKRDPIGPQLQEFLNKHREMLKKFEGHVEEKVKQNEEGQQPKKIRAILKEIPGKKGQEKVEKEKELVGAAAKKGAEEVAKRGVGKIAGQGITFIATKVCNIF